MQIDEIKNSDKTSVAVDDLVQRDALSPVEFGLEEQAKIIDEKQAIIDKLTEENAALKQGVAELRQVLAEVQAQRNGALDQAAQFAAMVTALRQGKA